jgi:hypothetical protein
MKARWTGMLAAGAALGLAALVSALAVAEAAPAQKKYSATVRVTGGTVTSTSATLRLTLTNRTRSQTLGSANFTPPFGVTNLVRVGSPSQPGWAVSVVAGVVEFRSTSGALSNDQSVSADVSVSIDQGQCGNAAWITAAKQSNDFSGSGNDFQFDAQSSDLVALGSFAIADIETVTNDGQHVPAILTGVGKPTTTTAYDICGEIKTTYSGATRSATLLTDATYSPTTGLNWSNGVGALSITPAVTETDNRLRVTDVISGVTGASNFFDTTDRLCTSTDTVPCEWSDRGGKLEVNSEPPPEDASLGIGFNSNLSFVCGDANSTVGGTPLVNINPRYEQTEIEAIAVTLTYKKSATGSGPATSFDVCFRKDDVTTWSVLEQCSSSTPLPAEAPCFISRKRVSGGDLEVVLWVKTVDPWAGLG